MLVTHHQMLKKQEIQNTLKKLQTQTELLVLSNHKALGDHLIIVPAVIKEPGITDRAVQYEDRPDVGLVVSVGNDVTSVKEGDVVFFGQYSHYQITHDDVTYLVLREEDLVCVVNQ